MKKIISQKGFDGYFFIDSAGTSGWHIGEEADGRMKSHAIRRGFELTSLSRKFYPDSDFEKFDMIIGMDDQNINDLMSMANSEDERRKVFRMTDFCIRHDYIQTVPDPYYSGDKGFELVLDILEDACQGLLEKLIPEIHN